MKRIILLCGLPGCGKTTYAKKLPYTFLNFDDFWSEYCGQSIDRFKESQNKFFEFVKYCVLPSYCSSPSSSLHEENNFFSEYRSKLLLKNSTMKESSEQRVVDEDTYLVEDNFYYRSMREKYCKFSRDKEVLFGMIFLIAPVEECIQRNSNRKVQVEEGTIQSMGKKIEYEKEVDVGDSCETLNKFVLNIDTHKNDFTTNESKIIEFVAKLQHLPKLKVKDLEEVEKSTVANLNSIIHQFDIWSRKEFSQFMKEKVPKERRREAAKKLSKERKEMITKLKREGGKNVETNKNLFLEKMSSFLS